MASLRIERGSESVSNASKQGSPVSAVAQACSTYRLTDVGVRPGFRLLVNITTRSSSSRSFESLASKYGHVRAGSGKERPVPGGMRSIQQAGTCAARMSALPYTHTHTAKVKGKR